MRKLFLILCTVCALFSCKKKEDTIAPQDLWVKQGYLDSQDGFLNMVLLRDTFVALYNEPTTRFYVGDGGTITGWNEYDSPTGSDYDATLLAAYQDRIYATFLGKGLYFSSDLSKTWTPLIVDVSSTLNVSDIVVTNAGLYLCAENIYFSTDKGDNWTDISMPEMVQASTLVEIDNMLIASVVTHTSVDHVSYTSVDNGANWIAVDPLSQMGQLPPIYKFSVVDNALYATVYNGFNGQEIHVSYDKGINWTKCEGLNALGNNAVTCLKLYKGTLYGGTVHGVFVSTDHGKNWVYSGAGDNVKSLIIKQDALYAAASQGIWKMKL